MSEANRHPPGTDRCLHCAVIDLAIKYVELGQPAPEALSLLVEALAQFIAANHSRSGRRGMIAAVQRDLAGAVAEKVAGRLSPDLEDTRMQ